MWCGNNSKERGAPINKSIRINTQIRANELRVVDADGEQLGVMTRAEALAKAEAADLDLVEISPNAAPPVAKIVDWGKYQYQKMKEQQRNKKSSKVSEIKQIRFGLKIGENDRQIKIRKILSFLDEGHKVKVMVVFKGREMAHREIGFQQIEKIIELLGEDVVADQRPVMAGRNLSTLVRRK